MLERAGEGHIWNNMCALIFPLLSSLSLIPLPLYILGKRDWKKPWSIGSSRDTVPGRQRRRKPKTGKPWRRHRGRSWLNTGAEAGTGEPGQKRPGGGARAVPWDSASGQRQ